MTAPDFHRGYLRIPHGVWLGTFCRARLTRRQLQLIAAVLRESWGWHDPETGVRLWTRPLSTSRFAVLTGLSTDRIARDVQALLAAGVLQERGGCYRFDPYASAPPRPPVNSAEADDDGAVLAAEAALPEPGAKKRERKETNALEASGRP